MSGSIFHAKTTAQDFLQVIFHHWRVGVMIQTYQPTHVQLKFFFNIVSILTFIEIVFKELIEKYLIV